MREEGEDGGTPEAAVRAVKAWVSEASSDFKAESSKLFHTTAFHNLKDIETSPGRCKCILPVSNRHSNVYSSLHGGAYAALTDVVGSAASYTVSKRGSGVSLTISVEYYAQMPVGEDLRIDAQVIKMGKSVSHVRVDFIRVKTGQLVAQGKHIEFLPPNAEDLPPNPIAKL